MKRFNVFLPQPMLKKLEKLAKKKGGTVAEIIRRAIDEYLSKEEK